MNRSEYPRPQFYREKWLNLNGVWQFEYDHGRSGIERKFFQNDTFSEIIQVPFCPESELSGLGYTDFMSAVWYKKQINLPDEWLDQRVLLHFGAVDYHAYVWVNGEKVGEHKGGYTPFNFDITPFLSGKETTIVVCAEDDNRSGLQPRGKQSGGYYSAGCDYTRTTGIWQTVWMEVVPQQYLKNAKYLTNPKEGIVCVDLEIDNYSKDLEIDLNAIYKGRLMASQTIQVANTSAQAFLQLSEVHLWEPGCAEIYDLTITLKKLEK